MVGNWWRPFLVVAIVGCMINYYLTSPKEEETITPSSSSLSESEVSQTTEEKAKQESSSLPQPEVSQKVEEKAKQESSSLPEPDVSQTTEEAEKAKQDCRKLIADIGIDWDSRKYEPTKQFLEFIENEFVPEHYDGSNGCKYLDFYYA